MYPLSEVVDHTAGSECYITLNDGRGWGSPVGEVDQVKQLPELLFLSNLRGRVEGEERDGTGSCGME